MGATHEVRTGGVIRPSVRRKLLVTVAMVLVVATVLLLGSAATAVAADCTWTGEHSAYWTSRENWEMAMVPGASDRAVFPSPPSRKTMTNDGLVRLKGMSFTGSGYTVDSFWPLTLNDGVTDLSGSGTNTVQMLLNLGGDAVFTSGSGSELHFSDVGLGAGVAGHGLTLAGAGNIELNTVSGESAASTITKTGAGVATLHGPSTFDGPVTLSEGTLVIDAADSLPSGVAVSMATSTVLALYPKTSSPMTVDNPFSGPGGARIQIGRNAVLSGDSSGFGGFAVVAGGSLKVADEFGGGVLLADGAVIGGSGSVGPVDGTAGGAASVICPGLADGRAGTYSPATLSVFYEARFDVTYRVTMRDATGDAGTGFDVLEFSGPPGVTVRGLSGVVAPFTTNAGGTGGACADFDPGQDYSWPMMHAAGGFTSDALSRLSLDTGSFANSHPGGTFSLALSDDATTISLVYERPTYTWTGERGPEWDDPDNWLQAWDVTDPNLEFPGSASTFRSGNNRGSDLRVHDVTFSTIGYDLSGDSLLLSGDVTADPGLLSGSNTVAMGIRFTSPVEHAIDVQFGTLGFTGKLKGPVVAGPVALRKKGAGFAVFGGGAGSALEYAGTTTVAEGTLITVGLDTAATQTFAVEDGASLFMRAADDASSIDWAGPVQGTASSRVVVDQGRCRLQSASAGFRGTVRIGDAAKATPGVAELCVTSTASLGGAAYPRDYGLLSGTGSVSFLAVEGDGRLSPGDTAWAAGALTATDNVTIGQGAWVVDVVDATGSAGSGYDALSVRGDRGITLSAATTDVVVRSSDGAHAADASNFDATHAYRWHLATCAPGTVAGFDGWDDDLDTSGFTNDLKGGAFSLEVSGDGASLDLVFTPSVPSTYAITVTAGPHGSISPGSGAVAAGSSPTYAITPDTGYAIAEVVVDGASVGRVPDYQFTSVAAAHTLAATFVVTPPGMPTTTVDGVVRGWSRRPETLTFTGHPGSTGAAVAFTEYKVGDGPWVRGDRVKVSAEGRTVVQYRSQDVGGVLQDPAGACTVRIDTETPRVVAKAMRGRAGKSARLRYKVVDDGAGSGCALVRAQVRDAAGHVLTRASSVPVKLNTWTSMRVSLGSVAPGLYTLRVRARDNAGNLQTKWTTVRLKVG